MYEMRTINDVFWLQTVSVNACPFVTHGFLGRGGGMSAGPYRSLNVSFDVGDDPLRVQENRAIAARSCGLPEGRVVFLRQVHGDQVVEARHPVDSEFVADAVMTDRKNLVLTVATADCVPILLCDPERPAIAAVHAGWKGTAMNIVGRTVAEMERRYGAKRNHIVAAIGPSIGECCYTVSGDVAYRLREWQGAGLREEGPQYRVSLSRINRAQLLEAGVEEEHVTAIDLCVSCHEELFFSHRRDHGQTGRQWNFIMILG